MTRGEVWWLDHPAAGRRPACILTRAEGVPVLTHILVALVTTRIRDIPTEVRLGPEDGMDRECAVSLDNLYLPPKALLTDRITTLSPLHMHRVCEGLRIATGC